MPDLEDIRRRINGMAGLLICLIVVQSGMVVMLCVTSVLISSAVKTTTQDQTLERIRSEFYAPMLKELRAVAEAHHGDRVDLTD